MGSESSEVQSAVEGGEGVETSHRGGSVGRGHARRCQGSGKILLTQRDFNEL